MRRSILLGCGALFVIAAISLLWALVAKEEEAKRETVRRDAVREERFLADLIAGCERGEVSPRWAAKRTHTNLMTRAVYKNSIGSGASTCGIGRPRQSDI